MCCWTHVTSTVIFICTDSLVMFKHSGGERILKICQHLAKLWTRVRCPVFWLTVTGYMFKFADDTYLVVPASNTRLRQDQVQVTHIERWAEHNNLRLNTSKSNDLVFCARWLRGKSEQLPPTCMTLSMLLTTPCWVLSSADWRSLLSSAASLLYALRILRSHDTSTQMLYIHRVS